MPNIMPTPAEVATVVARDGTALAYKIYGDHGPNIVLTNGFTTSSFYWRSVVERFASRARVVTWDLKGHGDSQGARSLDACTVADSVDDLSRVMDAAKMERATLMGFSLGCQIILTAWKHIPDRVQAFVPILGTYGRPFDNLIHPAVGKAAFGFFRRAAPRLGTLMMRGAWLGTRSPLAHPINQASRMVGSNVSRRTMQPFYDHFGKIDGPTWAAMGIAAQQTSAELILPSIRVPTLVISGGRDLFTPASLGRTMAERIPNAELLELPDAGHTGLFEKPVVIGDAVEAFLRRNHILV
jgi:pimeloyl-ACP methyl ester carboxylesterase